MSFSDKGTEEVESLVDKLTADGNTINESNLRSLSDLQQLAELSQELTLSEEMETEEQEIVIGDIHTVQEEVVETELGTEEIEIETERNASPEEILPDIKTRTTLPPLRPLTIAPKPPVTKVPIPVKAPQQLLLLQGTGAGQTIKLVSTQGQELNLAALSRPITIKPTVKTITSQGNITVVQPKQVVMKKIISPVQKSATAKPITFTNKQNIMFVQKTEGGQVKLVQNPAAGTLNALPSPTKTITLQQAQEMGILPGAKIISQGGSLQKQTLILNKAPTKTIKIVPQKSPTKILPATQTTTVNKGPQRIFIKTTGSGQSVIPSGQIIQLTGTQTMAPGQLHQINIPGKGMQYIKLVSSSSEAPTTSTTNVTTLKPVQASGSAGNIILSEIKPTTVTTAIAPKPIKPMPKTPINNLLVLPNYIQQTAAHSVSKVAIPMRHISSTSKTQAQTPAPVETPKAPPQPEPADSLDSNGIRPRKPCNCTKSQCLKLYCDCFANGEFCHMCNCMNCFNNLHNEDHRQRAIRACLERNPNAFRPKIGKARDTSGDMSVRKHTKGCNCKRSGCLKNYCECYEAKIACSNNCKCVGCRNIEDSMDKKSRTPSSADNGINLPQPMGKLTPSNKDVMQYRPRRSSNTTKQPINFITEDVIEATCQCLLSISDIAESNAQDEELTKSQIIEEFGRCLTEIIDCSSSRTCS